MPFISVEDNHLTVLNLFTTDKPENQDKLIEEMTKIVNAATYEGWMSSTVHAGVDAPGTANFIQWRSGEDLEKRYEGDEFKHRTMPVFSEITTSIRLLQNEVVYVLTSDELGGKVEIGPHRDDYTSITVFTVTADGQDEAVDALGAGQEFIKDFPGFRSNVVLKGLRARGLDGTFVVTYSQWDSKEAFEAFRDQDPEQHSEARKAAVGRLRAVIEGAPTTNTYKVVHTRAAGE
ncbi:antibiotic biosynthesis monooxygenase [Streptomyces sp. NRRL S-87]|uniref:antibiotic biosynthesis monooxygenase family protein n=1 Tax=Streptomyces sp. NRRL S-87 TaxID=1463920 RepID=UPI0004BF391D|nr:antibiotic biosynthesis monooxygenase family protein [Streptomyces sp. NRRL S-87]